MAAQDDAFMLAALQPADITRYFGFEVVGGNPQEIFHGDPFNENVRENQTRSDRNFLTRHKKSGRDAAAIVLLMG
jgi:hypothetical protein